MNISQLKKLADKGESQRLEFKKTTGQLHAAFEAVCAFLNSKKGGKVLIGVNDKGELSGQEISDQTQQEIANCVAKLEPSVREHLTIEYVPINQKKQVIVLSVASSNSIPHVYDGRPYEREQTTTKRMQHDVYDQLMIERANIRRWEEFPARDTTIKDLDVDEIRKTVEQGIHRNRIPETAAKESIPQILERLELLKNGVLNNAAAILYTKKMSMTYCQCLLKLARFRGKDKYGDFIDNKQLMGNAFQVLEEAEVFVNRHIPIASTFNFEKSFARIDKPAMPMVVVREALINAICHRDYSNDTGSLYVAVYDDRIEIWNPGKLMKGITLKDLKRPHISHQRNKTIAGVFYSRGFIERWGMGIKKMMDICKDAGLPPPKFSEYSGGFSIELFFAESIGASVIQVVNPITKEDQGTINLTRRQVAILNILQSGKRFTTIQIAEELDEFLSIRTLRRELVTLRDKNLIMLQGYGRNSVWLMLTDHLDNGDNGDNGDKPGQTRTNPNKTGQTRKKGTSRGHGGDKKGT